MVRKFKDAASTDPSKTEKANKIYYRLANFTGKLPWKHMEKHMKETHVDYANQAMYLTTVTKDNKKLRNPDTADKLLQVFLNPERAEEEENRDFLETIR